MNVLQMLKRISLSILLLLVLLSCVNHIGDIFIRHGIAVSNAKSERKWTVMMYMAADNNLESEAIQDINELESLNLDGNGITIISLLDRSIGYDGTNGDWADTRLLKIKEDEDGVNGVILSEELSSQELALTQGVSTELDMSKSNTLKSFLQFSINSYKAENYALFIWGHGNGWRSVTSDNFTNTTMTLSKLRNAIELGMGDENLDVLAFDTSFGCSLETLWELENVCSWFAGSAGSVDSSGWNYLDIYNYFLETELTIDDFMFAMSMQQKTSIINMQNLYEVKESFNEFSNLIAANIDTKNKQQDIRNLLLSDVVSYKASTYPTDMFLSLGDLVKVIIQHTSLITLDSNVQNNVLFASANLQNSLSNVLGSSSTENMSISIFLISFMSEGVPDSTYPNAYVKGGEVENTIRFVQENQGWTPTKNRNVSLLDKLFFSTY